MSRPFLCVALILVASGVQGEAAGVDFEGQVRPIFKERCIECHGEEKQKGRLQLDSIAGILRGGESGEPLFVSGKSAESHFLKRVASADKKDMMPPKGERLTTEQMATLRQWVDEGAKMPGMEEALASLKLKTDHWSFQPVKRPAVPKSGDAWVRGEIDEFIIAKLREKGLASSPMADKAILIRRLYLVMHGLPPSPQEVNDFQNDAHPDAWVRLVDRVLASPRYGERWARHWLDVVRYAESNGFETNHPRTKAWHYRDFVVEAFNSDKPYDQFIREQVAGDATGADAATGFLVAGAYDIVKGDPMLNAMQRQDELADMVNTTGTAFMGLTMGCARCHNHKFDPILQKDFYSMQAVFAGVNHGERPIRRKLDEQEAQEIASLKADEAMKQKALDNFKNKAASVTASAVEKPLRPAVNARMNEETFAPLEAVAVRFTILATKASEPCIDELEIYDATGQNVALASKGAKPTASGTLPGYAIHKLEHLNDGLLGNDHSWISNTAGTGWVQIDLPAKTSIHRIVWGRDRNGVCKDRIVTKYKIEAASEPGNWTTIATSDDHEPFSDTEDPNAFLTKLTTADADAARKIQAELADIRSRIARVGKAELGWLGTFSQPGKTHRLFRGEPAQQREVVAPDALSVLGTLGLAVDEPEQQRRVKLANWIASPQHPLTARVMVNRLWHYTFGQGIVDTPSDFGKNGSLPTHPELLDWLADEFVRSGWSIKQMQRLILLSAAFQQSSAPDASALKVDHDSRYLWRYTPRRLEAEAIRDCMLAISGALDTKMGGPGFMLMDLVPENVDHYFPKEKFGPAEFRRMVYQARIRQTTDSVFGSFDCPDGGQAMAKRSRSNTPLQALNLFNSTFVLQQAELLTERIRKEVGDAPDAQVARCFSLFYARPPDATEQGASAAMIRANGLMPFARALYNTSEFLFVF